MKKIYLLLSLILFFAFAHAQVFTTIADGDWDDPSKWDANGVPGGNPPTTGPIFAGIVNVNHNMNVPPAVTVFNFGASINISVGKTLDILPGSNFQVLGGGLQVNGTLKLSGGAVSIGPGLGTISGTGILDYATDGMDLPIGLNWAVGSLLKYTGIENTFPTTHADAYKDLEIACPDLSENVEILNTDIAKFTNIAITNTGSGYVSTDPGDLSTAAGNLTIGASGKLMVGHDSQLSVLAGTLSSAGNANLILQSTATGTGSLITNSSPNATIQRFVAKGAWHLIGPPVVGAIANTFLSGYMQRWHEYDGASAGYWEVIADPGSENTPLTRGEGDAFYFIPRDFTAVYTGTLLGGDLTMGGLVNTTNDGTDGYHCLANPYPSAITWAACTRTNVGAAQIYNGASYGSTAVIPAQQGFMTQVADNLTGSVTFKATAKTHNTALFFKNENPWGESMILKLTDNNETSNDQLIVRFNDEATFDYDIEFDARKIEGNVKAGEFFAHISDSDYASMIAVPFNEETLTIPLGFKKGDELAYTIELAEINFSNNLGIILEDVETGQFINLKNQATYTFTSTESNNNRFNLLFSKATGIEENGEDVDVNIWNAYDKVYIQSFENTSYDIFVYNVSGKIVKEIHDLSNESTSFLLKAPKGAYIIKYVSENKAFSQKIIK